MTPKFFLLVTKQDMPSVSVQSLRTEIANNLQTWEAEFYRL